jgi:hypothetical protein
MQIQSNRRNFLEAVAGLTALGLLARPDVIGRVNSYFTPPVEWRKELGSYRSPLIFNDGSEVKAPVDWRLRRAEILRDWMQLMGLWPKLITEPKVKVLEEKRRENFR